MCARHPRGELTLPYTPSVNPFPVLIVSFLAVAIVLCIVGYVRNVVPRPGSTRTLAPRWQLWLITGAAAVFMTAAFVLISVSD
jgi:NADH:ubiquinone oxidoreductase subunit H